MNLQTVQKLLEKEMDRKTFLLTVGTIGFGVLGISRILSHVEQAAEPTKNPEEANLPKKTSGYGSSPYGV